MRIKHKSSSRVRETLAKRLLFARRRLGVSQQDLGGALGITRNAIAQWESGKHEPQSVELLLRATQILRVDIYWLAGMRRPSTRAVQQRSELEE